MGAETNDPLVAGLAEGLRPEVVGPYTEFAIRTRSPLAPQVLAAAGEEAAIARITALSGAPDAHARGLEQLDRLIAREGLAGQSAEILTLWAQLLVRADRDEELGALLADPEAPLKDSDRWALRTDLLNPHRPSLAGRGSPEEFTAAEGRWLAVLNEIHTADSLEPVRLRPAVAGENPYQRLTAAGSTQVDGDLVTVVMSAFRPDRDLLLAVRGVLDQTWRNIELLVIDDASPSGAEELLEEAESLDERVRVVRAPRNGGTYEARNLALTIAQGRWMTFQDSDDWTHPFRVEAQVRHLLEHPEVLANRTWTLRAYEDLTLTYVGYSSARLNASSLLFDRLPVTRLVGGFDSVRKSGDMELPFRLQALRKDSVRDLRRPAPLAITQLRSNSLSRADAIPGWLRWDRLAYRDSYMEWHDQIRASREPAVLPHDGRPFPLPRRSWSPQRPAVATPLRWQVVVLGDLRTGQPRNPRTLGVARAASDAGWSVAVANAESPTSIAAKRESLSRPISHDVRLGRVALTNVHEQDHVDLLVVTGPETVLHLDESHLQVNEVLVVADEAEPGTWTVEAVDRRCQELFGSLPRWGGPARIHHAEEGPSPVRVAVPDERWLEADLAVVTGATWWQVGDSQPATRPRQEFVAIGHHLRDYTARWPKSPIMLQAAYPQEGTRLAATADPANPAAPADQSGPLVQVHALGGLTTPTSVLGRQLPPTNWCSFLGTGMTLREFLSHLDVWVYQGAWDLHAEIAALEALAAGLPCVLPAAAADCGLEGRVACVEPAQTLNAARQLLDMAPAITNSAQQRQAAWSAVLTDLLGAGQPSGDAPAALLRTRAARALRAQDYPAVLRWVTPLLDREEATTADLMLLLEAARNSGDHDLLERGQVALLHRTPRSRGTLRRVVASLGGLRTEHLQELQRWRDRLHEQPPLPTLKRTDLERVDTLLLEVRVEKALASALDDATVGEILALPGGPTQLVRRLTHTRRFADLDAQLPTWLPQQLDEVSPGAWRWLGRHASTHGWTRLSALASARWEGVDTPGTRDLIAEAEDEHDILTHPWQPPVRQPAPDPAQLDPRSVVSVLGQSLPLRSGGYATRSHGILTSLIERGWKVSAVTRLGFPFDLWWSADDPREPAPVEKVDGVPYHRLLTEGVRHYPRVPLAPYVEQGAKGIADLARQERASLIHASSLYDVGMAGLTAARSLGVPFVYEMRGLKQLLEDARQPLFSDSPRRDYLDQLEGTVARSADALLVITEALGQEMVRMGVDPARITVVPNGVDISRFTPRERDQKLADQLGLAGQTVIGYLGGLVHYEGLDLLCEAIAELRTRRDDFHVLVVGDGAYERKLHMVVEELGVGDLITFTGRVPHEQIGSYLSLVDITPFPRKPLPVCEMISPIKPFEAMAMRKTVVASDVAALTEIVQDGVTGRLFAKGDSSDLARVLGELLDDPAQRERLGDAARDWVVAERDWRHITAAVDGVYAQLLGGSTAS